MSIDGGITGRNACFYDPYEDDEHNHGIIRIQQDELNDTVQDMPRRRTALLRARHRRPSLRHGARCL